MTSATTTTPPERPWHTPTPGPVAVLAQPAQVRQLVRGLRHAAARHDDTAWVHPAPRGEREPIPTLSQDLLDAIGVVGLRAPRTTGDSHLLRPLTHLIHGPVRHIIIDDASTLPTPVLTELHQATLLARTQLWLVIDVADRPASRGTGLTRDGHAADVLAWVDDTCHAMRPDNVLDCWQGRRPTRPHCTPPPHHWWHTPLDAATPLPTACPQHPHQGRVRCLLAGLRRALTAGTVTPTTARTRLIEYTDHPDTTATDRWELAAAGRDVYTPGIDALRRTHPAADAATLAGIAHDGSHVLVNDELLEVTPTLRPAVARLRTSRLLAGALPHEPIDGVFDEPTGIRLSGSPRPRRLPPRHLARLARTR